MGYTYSLLIAVWVAWAYRVSGILPNRPNFRRYRCKKRSDNFHRIIIPNYRQSLWQGSTCQGWHHRYALWCHQYVLWSYNWQLPHWHVLLTQWPMEIRFGTLEREIGECRYYHLTLGLNFHLDYSVFVVLQCSPSQWTRTSIPQCWVRSTTQQESMKLMILVGTLQCIYMHINSKDRVFGPRVTLENGLD